MAVHYKVKEPRWYSTGLAHIPYCIPYTEVMEENDVLGQVSFIAKMIHFINLTHYILKRTDIGLNLAYPYGTSTNTAIKIGFQTADSTGIGSYIQYPYPLYVWVQWASLPMSPGPLNELDHYG